MLKMTTLLSGSLSALFLAWYFFSNLQEPAQKTVLTPIFSAAYPVHPRFLREISQMRSSLTLNSENENLIHVSAHNAEAHLGIPQSLLWCLMFQESRLNHLSGLASGKLSTGLGQFSNSAFFEVNHHLKLYFDSPRTVLNALMGLDIRPLQSNPEEVSAINSYYFIPTGVTATALYLSNRWIQLTRVAQKRNLTYSPDILWAWSAISYNKGTRSVLAIWNQIEAKEGIPGLTQA
ncbi:hypothetical protein EBT16_05935, partial [bacterium]|nr:hypothetical protein [bacterium]